MSLVDKISTGVAGVTGVAQSALNSYNMVENPDQRLSIINSTRLQPQAADDSYNNLLGDYNNLVHFNKVNRQDLGYNTGRGIFNVISAGGSGAAAGASIGGGYGAAIGGAIGLIGGLVGLDAGKRKADRNVKKINNAIDDADAFNHESITNRLRNLGENETLDLYRSTFKQAADGGPLTMRSGVLTPFGSRFDLGGGLSVHGGDFDNGLTFINEGSTHEQNPNDGVQMGVDPQGIPNLVEEGEVIYKDYVFSNRLKVPNAVRKKYKLTGQKELTFADAAKFVQKESEERPNDPISKRGLEDWMSKLADEQETVRQKKAVRKLQKQAAALGLTPEEYMAMQMQQEQQMQAIAAYGGGITIKPSKRGTFTAAASKHGMGVQEFASKVLANKDDYSPAMVKKANFAKNAASWKHGLGGNIYSGDDESTLSQQMYLNPYEYYGWFTEPELKKPEEPSGIHYTTSDFWKRIPTDKEVWTPGYGMVKPAQFAGNVGWDTHKLVQTTPLKPKDEEDPGTGNSSHDWTTGLRYAPVIGSALNVISDLAGWTNKPDYSNADAILNASKGVGNVGFRPVGQYLRYSPFDRLFYANQLQANAAAQRRALMNTSGGNRGTAMAGILASDYNTLNSLGKLYREAEEYNLAQRERVQTFNRETDKFNSEYDLKTQMANQGAAEVRMKAAETAAQLRDAIDARIGASKSANLTNLFDNIGNIGWEAYNRNMVNSSNPLYGMNSSGRVYYKPGIKKYLSKDDFDKLQKLNQGSTEYKRIIDKARRAYRASLLDDDDFAFAANGGYITIKKKR